MKKQKNHKVLSDIYGGNKPTRTIERGKKKRTAWIYALVLGCLAIIGVSTYLILQTRSFNDKNIIISIDTPPTITSGIPTEIAVHYTNNQSLTLSNAELSLKFPKGFSFTTSTPETEVPLTFPLGTLSAHEKGSLTIAGTYTGAVDSAEQIRATLNYRPSNFNADFQKITTSGIRSSILPFTAEFKETKSAATLSPTSYTLSYAPTTTTTARAVLFAFPESFTVTSSTPELKNNLVQLLALNKPQTIIINGAYSSAGLGDQSVKATIGASVHGTFINESTVSTTTNVTKPALTVKTTINEKEQPTLAAGDTIALLTEITNDSATDQKNVVLTYEIIAPVVSKQSILLLDALKSNKSLTITSTNIANSLQKITITTKKSLTSLETIKPGETKPLSINIPVVSFTGSVVAPILITTTVISDTETVATVPISIPWRAGTSVKATVIPNTTIEKTVASDGITEITRKNYATSWTITNPIHDLEDVVVVVTLAPGVTAGISTQPKAGTLEYIPSTNILRYTINKFPASIGSLSFDATLYTSIYTGDPETTILSSKTTLTATDTTTLEPFSQTLPPIARP